jgi:hypothetical protein
MPSGQLLIYKVLSFAIVLLMAVYTFIRWYTNSIAGIYCLKRMLLGFALGLTSVAGGIDQNVPLAVFMLIGI